MLDNNDIGFNSVTARAKAQVALDKAKKLENQQLKEGATWKRQGKTAVLVKKNTNSGHSSTKTTNHTATS